MRKRSFIGVRTPRQSAQALIEFALILPVMLIMLLGGIDIGRALVYGVEVQDGARAAARLGAAAASDGSVSDTAVLQRLIDASSPALGGCAATTSANQSCGGATWTLNVLVVTKLGTCNTAAAGCTIAAAKAADALANCHPLPLGPVCQLSAAALTVTATGQVSMLSGFNAMGMSLFPITARGQSVMVVL